MPWAGGNYTKGNNGTGGWVGDASLGIGIEAGRHDTQDNDFATGINACLNKDGSNAATANLNLGAFRYTNAGAATARTDLAQVAQVQDGDYVWLGTTGGTATAQTASASPAISAYKAGQKFRMKIGAGLGSTGSAATAHTLNINSIGTKNIVNRDATNPTVGTWVAGAILELVYDGTNLVIINNPQGILSYTPTLTGNGGLTISDLAINEARYIKNDKIVTVWIDAVFTTGGVANPAIDITLPINSSGHPATQVLPTLNFDVATILGYAQVLSTAFRVSRDVAATNWGLGTNRYIRLNINYIAV